MSKPRLLERFRARKAARELWISRKSDPTVADLLAKALDGDEDAGDQLLASHADLVGIDPATLFLLIQMAIRLWIWWNQNKVEVPSEWGFAGEPFDATDDDDE